MSCAQYVAVVLSWVSTTTITTIVVTITITFTTSQDSLVQQVGEGRHTEPLRRELSRTLWAVRPPSLKASGVFPSIYPLCPEPVGARVPSACAPRDVRGSASCLPS